MLKRNRSPKFDGQQRWVRPSSGNATRISFVPNPQPEGLKDSKPGVERRDPRIR
jgi:hypothetical protein